MCLINNTPNDGNIDDVIQDSTDMITNRAITSAINEINDLLDEIIGGDEGV